VSVDVLVLRDADAQARYVRDLVELLRQARLSRQYPPVVALTSHLQALSPRFHGGVYGELHVHPWSGLPTLREWARVRADQAVAARVVASGAPEAERDPRVRYHRRLLERPLIGLDDLHLDLRRLDAAAPRADLRLRFDKLDREGCFVRFVVEMSTRRADDAAALATEEGRAALAERLKRVVYPYAEADAEWALIHLEHAPDFSVERVERGTVGPLLLGALRPGPVHGLPGVVLGARDSLGSFGLDTAGRDVAEDRDDDPLARLVVDRLSPQARAVYLEGRKQLGYHVFKGRKFVASPALVSPLRATLEQLGTRSVVYGLRQEAA